MEHPRHLLECQWNIHEGSRGYTWDIYEIPTGYLWKMYGTPWKIDGISMEYTPTAWSLKHKMRISFALVDSTNLAAMCYLGSLRPRTFRVFNDIAPSADPSE